MAKLITVVIANYNMAAYLEETIKSVISQNYSQLELIVVDGNSNDESHNIILKYGQYLKKYIRESDNGLYDALSKGFSHSTGDIMTYINSDDLFYPNTFVTVNEIFEKNENISWITGIPNQIDELGRIVWSSEPPIWSKYKYAAGDFKYIQQEGTFWSRDLWLKSGGYINAKCKLAGDLELWSRFFEHSELYTVQCFLAAFRLRSKGQLSNEKIELYNEEASTILSERVKFYNVDNNLIKIYNSFLFKRLLYHKLFFILKIIGYIKVYELFFDEKLLLKFNRQSQNFYNLSR